MSATTYTLNEKQKEIADEFFKFLISDEKELILSGAAGTGKTFLMRHMIEVVYKKYLEMCDILNMEKLYLSIDMTATTHRAAEVLSNSVGFRTETIHSYLSLKVKEDFKTGKTNLQRTRNWEIKSNTIVFIDEASMIDRELYDFIVGSFTKSKIIYVGDHSQLAPVFEKISRVYARNIPMQVLTEPMRNNTSPHLMTLCQQFRDTVETGEFKDIICNGTDIIKLSAENAEQHINNIFIDPNHTSKILSYTNARVIQYNNHIRNLRKLPKEFTVGEKVVNASMVYPILGGGSNSILTNSLYCEQEVSILEISDIKSKKIFVDADIEYREVKVATLNNDYTIQVPINMEHYQKLIKYAIKQKAMETYFLLKNTFADLRSKDASTIHKAQGSTYDSVFIDLSDITVCRDKNQLARMLYVAVSRAKYKIYFYGDLNDKYGRCY